jgi:hypothetical protein
MSIDVIISKGAYFVISPTETIANWPDTSLTTSNHRTTGPRPHPQELVSSYQ